MSLTLDLLPALEQHLRTLAAARGLPVEQVGTQAIAAGLAALHGLPPETALQLRTNAGSSSQSATAITLPSPLKTTGLPRTLTIEVEPAIEPPNHAH